MTYAEELARALYAVGNPRGEWGTATSLTVHQYLQQAHDVLDAIKASGCKVVRREPTEMMVLSAADAALEECIDGFWCKKIFSAMFDAAPQVPEARDE